MKFILDSTEEPCEHGLPWGTCDLCEEQRKDNDAEEELFRRDGGLTM